MWIKKTRNRLSNYLISHSITADLTLKNRFPYIFLHENNNQHTIIKFMLTHKSNRTTF